MEPGATAMMNSKEFNLHSERLLDTRHKGKSATHAAVPAISPLVILVQLTKDRG